MKFPGSMLKAPLDMRFVIFTNSNTIPARNKTSPTLVTRNAFLAAAAADGLWNQNPISRYEQRPTSSYAIKN